MVDCQFFAGFDFRFALPDGPTYTPEAALRERPYCFSVNPAELSAPSFVGKLRLATNDGKRYNRQPS